MTPTIRIPAPTVPKPSVAHHAPTSQRPTATLRKSRPGASNPKIMASIGSDSPSQSGNTNRRQTRGVTALATQGQRQAVDFVSGGVMENNDKPIKDPEEPPGTRRLRTRGNQTKHTVLKGKKKASIPSWEDDSGNPNVPALPSHQPVLVPTSHQPTKAIQRVKTREQLGNDAGSLDQASYRFEGSESPGSSPPPVPPQSEPTLVSSHPVQLPALQSLSPTALSQMFPDLQLPDPNNMYDQLRFYEGAPSKHLFSTFPIHQPAGTTQHLVQSLTTRANPEQPPPHRPSPEPTPRPISKCTNKAKKITNLGNPTFTRGHRQHGRPSLQLSTISEPKRGDKTPLELAMGMNGRHNTYVQIRGRVRKIVLNVGLDWSMPWPKVPPDQKSMLYQMVRSEIPYMGRFIGDWATARIASEYAGHLRASARMNGELPVDPRYGYLKDNAGKRRKDAPRGIRPGLAKGQGEASTSNGGGRNPGPSGAGPSSLQGINTVADVDMMDEPSLFGFKNLSDDEGESSSNDNLDSGGRK